MLEATNLFGLEHELDVFDEPSSGRRVHLVSTAGAIYKQKARYAVATPTHWRRLGGMRAGMLQLAQLPARVTVDMENCAFTAAPALRGRRAPAAEQAPNDLVNLQRAALLEPVESEGAS